MEWRGVEDAKARRGFIRVCTRHRQRLTEGAGDTLLCPIGHVAETFDVVDEQKFKPGAVTASTGGISMPPTTDNRQPTTSLRLKAGSKKIFETQAFSSLGGHRMWISLEMGGRIAPYIVRVKHKAEAGVRTGVLDSAHDPGEAKKAYEERVQAAVRKGWRLGVPSRSNMLTDIPEPGTAKPPVKALRRA